MIKRFKSLRDILFCYSTENSKTTQKAKKMMSPNRTDVNVNYCQTRNESSSVFCKIIRMIFFILILCLFLLLISSLNQELDIDTKENERSEPTPPPPCNVEITERLKDELKVFIQKEIQQQSKACSKSSRLNPEQMRSMIKEEIKRQQKIQLKPDFASASAGGMVIEASPTWTEGYSYIYFLFIPIRSTAPPPSIILEPTRQAGDCWPMEGQKGSFLIQLAARANIVGFTMEHIDPAMSLSGGTPEAPNNFSVYGIEYYDATKKRYLFGTYSYNNKNDEESQYFRVQNINRKSFLYILVDIASNHGNDKYTCIYRFQVHGFIDRAYHCET